MEFLGLSGLDIILRLALGLGIGFSIGLTGIGGGVLVMPALTVILGIEPVKAVGTTSLYAFLTKILATFQHARLKTIEWGTSLRFLIGAVPADVTVSFWISRQGANASFQHGLKLFIAGVVFLSAGLIILNLIKQSRTALETEERSLAERINGHKVLRNGLSTLMGIVVGSLIGATSIGGGVLIVPILIILFNLPALRTVGSSIFIAVVLTLMSSLIYGLGGEIDHATAITMAIGSPLGVFYGSRLSTRLPDKYLKIIVIAIILTAAVLMIRYGSH